MPRTILIVDDISGNREILKKILGEDYSFLEAGNGQDAMESMLRNYKLLSAVLLDLAMPVMNGFEVLEKMRANASLSQIPVIVMTGDSEMESEAKALSLGANDYITKPYNPTIIRQRIKNTINLRETAATVNFLQRDKLTGLYNREAFFDKAAALLRTHMPGYYIMAGFDINNFKFINDQYGSAEGDNILRFIGRAMQEDMEAIGGMACRMSADNFAAIYPAAQKETDFITRMQESRKMPAALQAATAFSVGRYIINDLTLSPRAMYDRAYIAKQSVKGRYDVHIAYFDEAMRDRLLREQTLIGEMDTALSSRQFEIWFQPQYNHASGALVGAEALVRWRHPERGLIPPGNFIPVFEQNGFIYALDQYVWEEACRYLRKWIDEGRAPLPVSVNISRYDVLRNDLTDVITGLVKKYDIPVELLRLEITESAFAKSADQIITVVKGLMDCGFTMEIDDFGSGYSSLNTLKDVPADVLKLDMRFLENSTNSQRGGNIVESIVRMAKWLDMSVIAEGVEKVEQADFLKSIGCNYVQGYLYARPMPAQEYEALAKNIGKEERLLALQTVANLDNDAFWDPTSMDTLIFNSFVGGACIFEYHNGNIEILRANDKYVQVIGSAGMTVEDAVKLDWMEHLDENNRTAIRAALQHSIETREETTGEFLFLDLPNCPSETYLRLTMRVIASSGDRYLVYCINENMTAQRQTQQKLLDNMPCGAALYELEADGEKLTALHLNKRFQELVGRKIDNLTVIGVYHSVHPDDRDALKAELMLALKEKRDLESDVRIRCGEEEYRPFHILGRIVPQADGKYALYASYTPIHANVTSYQEMLPIVLATLMRASSDLAFVKDKDFRYICCSRTFAQMAGLADEKDAVGKTDYDLVSKPYADKYRAIEEEILQTGEARLDYDEILPSGGDTARYGTTSKYPLMDAAGNVIGIYGVTRDITQYRAAFEQLRLLTDNIPGGIATYACSPGSIKILYFNDGFCRLFGFTREKYEEKSKNDPISLVFEEDLPLLMAQVEALVRDDTPIDCMYRLHMPDGGYKWINHKAVTAERHGATVISNAMLIDVTEQQEATERLRISEEEHRLAMKHSGNIICRYTVADKTISMSAEAAASFSIPEKLANVPYEAVRLGMVAPESVDAYTAFFEDILRGCKTGALVFQQKTVNGWRWMEANFSTIFSVVGDPVSAVVSFCDVTERLEKETVYKKWQQSLQEKIPDSYTLFRCNLSKNASFDTMEGNLLHVAFTQDDSTFNQRTEEYVKQCVYEEDQERYAAILNSDTLLANYYRGKRSEAIEYREKLPEGGTRWLRLSIDLVEYPNSTDVEVYLMYENIDEAKQAELLTQELAQNDPLTGILNRHTFMEEMNQMIREGGDDALYALLMLDLDGFKLVNDSFGHEVGDRALIDAAQTLHGIVRHGDLVGRLGGDEFVVCLSCIKGKADAGKKARQICNALRRSFSIEVQMSASVGIAVCPQDGPDFETLYHKADVALYHVKATGKDNYTFYSADMEGEKPHADGAVEDIVALPASHKALKRRMLIVEDNKTNRDMLAGIFKEDFIIDTADDGNTALIRMHRYGAGISVVLLDIMMPGMDGFAVLEKMRAHAELQTIPVVVVSGMDEQETSLRTIQCGASDFVTKPVDPSLLRLRVESAISKAENERLRAQNSYLSLQSNEVARYRAILENDGTVMAEYDVPNESFTYDPMLSQYIAGVYDDRPLWRIFLADKVADAETIMRLQELVRSVLADTARISGSLMVTLKTPASGQHRFVVKVVKRMDEFHLGDKLLLTFTDAGRMPGYMHE